MERILAWLREAAITIRLIGRQGALSLRNNWGIGLLSLMLAVSLWVFVTDRENPDRSGPVPGTVPIERANVPPDQAICSISEESVTVRARAAESVLERLTAADFRATIDLRDVSAQEATVAVLVESEEPRAEVVAVSPAQVRVKLESVTSRTVPVRVNPLGTPLRGFEQGAVTVEPAEAVVTGPMCLVGRVERVTADVNLTGREIAFEETLLLQAEDELGGLIRGVNVEPERAKVQVEVGQVEFPATFIVRPDVLGLPADGYRVTAVQVNPPTVVVTGPAEVLESIDATAGIETEAVSIDEATADVVRTVALRLPEGARIEQPVVTVRVSIEPAQGQFSFMLAPQVINVPSEMSATLAQATVQVILAGPVPDLNAIDVADMVATVDLAGLEAGEHVISVTIEAPPGTTLVSITPAEVEVTLGPP